MKQKPRRWSASFCTSAVWDAAWRPRRLPRAARWARTKRHAIYLRDRVHVFRQPQTVNTGDLHTPNNYDIWLCPVCGRNPLGNSQERRWPQIYICRAMDVADIAAAGGDMGIRYALVRHRHNNGQLSNDRVYIPVNVPMYAGCYYGYDLTEPAGVQADAPTGWQRDSAVVRVFAARTQARACRLERGAGRPAAAASIIMSTASTAGMDGLSVDDPTVTITAGGETTVTPAWWTARATPPARRPR